MGLEYNNEEKIKSEQRSDYINNDSVLHLMENLGKILPEDVVQLVVSRMNGRIVGSTHWKELQTYLKGIGIRVNQDQSNQIMNIISNNMYCAECYGSDAQKYLEEKEKAQFQRVQTIELSKEKATENYLNHSTAWYTKEGITDPETVMILNSYKAFFKHYRHLIGLNFLKRDIRGVGTNAIIIKRVPGFVDKFPFVGVGIANIEDEYKSHQKFYNVLEKGRKIRITAERVKDGIIFYQKKGKIIDKRYNSDPTTDHFINSYFKSGEQKISIPFVSDHVKIPKIYFMEEEGFKYLRIKEIQGNTVSTLYDIQTLYGELLNNILLPAGINFMTDYEFHEFLKYRTNKTSEQLSEIQLKSINSKLLVDGLHLDNHEHSGIPTLKLLFNETRSHYIEFTLALYYLNLNGLGHVDLHNENIMVDKERDMYVIDFGMKKMNF